jgi:hypothetical protein
MLVTSGGVGNSLVEEFETSPYAAGRRQPGDRCREEHSGCKPPPEAGQAAGS